MAITGYLAEFSLAEIFQFLEQGGKTGLLTICPLIDSHANEQNHHIWFNHGCIVAAASSLNQQGLLSIISRRGWMGDRAASRLAQTCPLGTPMGLCLKARGALSADQLKLLFYVQVMQQVCSLFGLKDGWFQFDGKAPRPLTEMTGLSAPATEVTLAGLRALKDWSMLADKLPEANSALISIIEGKPNLRLNQLEWQAWEFAKGTMSLSAIAKHLQISTEKIQQIGFRLIVAGLVEEVPSIADAEAPITNEDLTPLQSIITAPEAAPVSQSFLKNLVGFLRSKV